MSAVPARAPDRQYQHASTARPRLKVVAPEDADPGLWNGTNETLNFYTHAAGFVLSLCACGRLASLVWNLADPLQVAACTVYGMAMLAVYGASTLSHGMFSPLLRQRFRTLDQVSIFGLIAATSGPFLLGLSRDWWGMTLLAGTWGLAIVGIVCKLFVTKQKVVPVWYYILVAWFPAISLVTVGPLLGWAGLFLVGTSGLAFMIGTWFLSNDHRASWYHAVWHLLVIVGTSCQYFAVTCCVLERTGIDRF